MRRYPFYVAAWPGIVVPIRNEREWRSHQRMMLVTAVIWVATAVGGLAFYAYQVITLSP